MQHTEVSEHPAAVRRKRLGLTQKDAARRAGLSRQTVIKIESGARIVQAGSLQKLAKALDVNWREIAGPGQAVMAQSREDAAELLGVSPGEVKCACQTGHDPQAIIAEWLGLDPTEDAVRQYVDGLQGAMTNARA